MKIIKDSLLDVYKEELGIMTKEKKIKIQENIKTQQVGFRMPVKLIKELKKEQKRRGTISFSQMIFDLLTERIESIENDN